MCVLSTVATAAQFLKRQATNIQSADEIFIHWTHLIQKYGIYCEQH